MDGEIRSFVVCCVTVVVCVVEISVFSFSPEWGNIPVTAEITPGNVGKIVVCIFGQ